MTAGAQLTDPAWMLADRLDAPTPPRSRAMLLVSGHYCVANTLPDGDSIRFRAHDPRVWTQLESPPRLHWDHSVALRLDGIDALETHYLPRAASTSVQSGSGTTPRLLRQPGSFGDRAAQALLTLLGVGAVIRYADGSIAEAQALQAPGWIAARGVDRYGRVVSWAWRGIAPETASHGMADPVAQLGPWLPASANLGLLTQGLVYPDLYASLDPRLRARVREATDAARGNHLGLWPEDRSVAGFQLDGVTTLTDMVVILPRLFRRLADFCQVVPAGGPGLAEYLRARGDRVLRLPEVQMMGFDECLAIHGSHVRLMVAPEALLHLDA